MLYNSPNLMAESSRPNHPPVIQPQRTQFLANFKLPDISFWQDDPTTAPGINFVKMASQTRGVIIRAGQGSFEDKVFKTSWNNAKAAGMLRGSYWFYDSRVNPKRQAEKWVEILGNDTGEMEMWGDFEENYGGPYGGWRNWFDFMERVKVLLPEKKLGVYTGYYYFQENAAGVRYFAQYPLWIAWYNPQEPLVPSIWEDWTYWQFTSNGDGALFGVESKDIDLNYFNGSEADFLSRYNAGTSQATLIANFGGTLVEYRRVS